MWVLINNYWICFLCRVLVETQCFQNHPLKRLSFHNHIVLASAIRNVPTVAWVWIFVTVSGWFLLIRLYIIGENQIRWYIQHCLFCLGWFWLCWIFSDSIIILTSFLYFCGSGIGIVIDIILNVQMLYGHFQDVNSSNQWTWVFFPSFNKFNFFLIHIKVVIIEVFLFPSWLFQGIFLR